VVKQFTFENRELIEGGASPISEKSGAILNSEQQHDRAAFASGRNSCNFLIVD
jgi:hypothetical protein